MSRSKRIWLALGTATLLIAVTAIVTGRVPGCGPNYWLAAYLGGHLKFVPDELVAAEMRQIATLDQVGLCMLLDALGSSRPSVADAAAATLHEQLNEWGKLPRERSSKSVARVASELARRVDAWPHPARCVAADLALRILDWPIDNRQVPRATLIADCEYVMRTQQGSSGSITSQGASAELSPIENAARPETPRDVRGSVRGSATAVSGVSADWDTAPTPGGDLPIAETELPPVTASLAEFATPRPAEDREPDLLPPSRSNSVPSSGKMSLSDEPQPVPAPPTSVPLSDPPFDAPPSVETRSQTPAGARLGNLETRSDLDLIRSLDGHDPELARQVMAILGQRGFRRTDLALAHQLASPDVATRRQLVEKVGRLPAGAARWLIWLSQDPDPTVRQAAVSLMVTAQDPAVQRRLRAMENAEVDQDVREQLRNWRETRQ